MDDGAFTAYLARIGVAPTAVARPDRAALEALMWGHVTSIPFENLDVLLGRPIDLALDAIVAKLVHARRGGYCFEHNTLLAAALEHVGFAVSPVAARVRWLATGPTGRTHMALIVERAGAGSGGEADGRAESERGIDDLLVDVGFGGHCPTGPIAFGAETQLHHDRFRLRRDSDGAGDAWMLELAPDGEPMYLFSREPAPAVDFEIANHYTSTHPSSRFKVAPLLAIHTAHGRVTLRGTELRRGDTRETIDDPARYLALLANLFGLVFPPGTRFPGGA